MPIETDDEDEGRWEDLDDVDEMYDVCSVDHCAARTAWDVCDCCGTSLCSMHYALGAGFCRSCPTPAWIAEQEQQMAEREQEGG